ncbi:hypothetical protein E2C01_067257 [Portunus trituberculatus]|uniref:Uncharacterized protein n=1 Tax=Portunus trituberculatus TaxID=210409 RepID=A0A5B7HS54_PORTR|nr:hypothetical protein [Portunus trituberculatus]
MGGYSPDEAAIIVCRVTPEEEEEEDNLAVVAAFLGGEESWKKRNIKVWRSCRAHLTGEWVVGKVEL